MLDSTFISPSLWLEPFLPTTAVEPVLPDPDAPNDPVAFKEVTLAEGQVCCRSCAVAAVARPLLVLRYCHTRWAGVLDGAGLVLLPLLGLRAAALILL